MSQLLGVALTVALYWAVCVGILVTIALFWRAVSWLERRRVRKLLRRSGMSDPGLDRLMRDVFDKAPPPRIETPPPPPDRFLGEWRGNSYRGPR